MPDALRPFADGEQMGVVGRVGAATHTAIRDREGQIEVLPASAAMRRSRGGRSSALLE